MERVPALSGADAWYEKAEALGRMGRKEEAGKCV